MNTPRWSGIKRVGSSYPSKLSVLLPFIGHIILFQEPVTAALVNAYASIGIIQPAEEIRSSLLFLYYGIILFGVGSIMYYMLCPTEVSLYPDRNGYIGSSIDKITIVEIKIMLDEIQSKHSNKGVREQSLFHAGAIAAGVSGDRNRDVAVFALSSHYENCEASLFAARAFISILYVSGIALVSAPSLIVMWKVTKKTFFT